MRFVCRKQTCQKQFSAKFNRNKHERIKGHFEESKQATCKIPHNPSTYLYSCPRIDCKTISKYKQNILKHLKSCSQVNLNKATAKENRTCGICNKTFAKKSNRDRHIQSVHHDDIDDGNDVFDELIIEDEAFPSMAFRNLSNSMSPLTPTTLPLPSNAIVTVPPSNLMSAPPLAALPASPVANITVPPSALPPTTFSEQSSATIAIMLSNEMSTPKPAAPSVPSTVDISVASVPAPDDSSIAAELTLNDSIPLIPETSPLIFARRSRLESFIEKIVANIDYAITFNSCVISHLKKELKENRRKAVIYMRECFATLLDDKNFLRWLSKEVDYKPYLLKNLVSSKPSSNRKSYSVPQKEVYDFWLQNSITFNDSTNSTKRISKMSFMRNFKEIKDENIREEEKTHKKGSKLKMVVATKRIYTNSVRTLHKRFNEDQEHPISLTAFFKHKPFYVLKPSEKEKQSCLCIYCLNPHVILKAINTFRTLRKLAPHDSLTEYLKSLEASDLFDEIDAKNDCKYYEYKRIKESYYEENGKSVEYTRTAHVDLCEPVCKLVQKLRDIGPKYLKHRTYVDNCAAAFPLLKDRYEGKFTELDFSKNLSLRPKDEVQSAHFSGKQFTLHCSIVEPTENRYHYHLSDDKERSLFLLMSS